MKKYSKRALLVNTFGSFGYIACFLLWGWTGIVYVPMVFENESLSQILLPEPAAPVAPPPVTGESSALTMIAGVAVAVVIVIVTVVVLLRAPVTIAKTGQTITSKAAVSALPLITHGKPLAPAKKKRLTIQLIKLMKLLLVLLPLLALTIGLFVELSLPLSIVALISSLLAFASVFWFSLQYIVARLLGVEPSQLV